MNRKNLFIPYIPLIIGIATAEIYLLIMSRRSSMPNEGNGISIEGIIAIVVALIGVAGGIWAQVVQFKKDAKRIDDVDKSIGGVKSDTSEIKPQVSTVNENVKKIRDEVVEKVVPRMGKLSGIDTLVKAHEIEQALKRENSPNIYDKDILKGTIDLVYTENARLSRENKEKNYRITELQIEKSALDDKCLQFEMELQQTKKANSQLSEEIVQLKHELAVSQKSLNQKKDKNLLR